MKTSELIGPALDWAVAKCEGAKGLRLHTYRGIDPLPPAWVIDWEEGWIELSSLDYSANWKQGGPIIERERLQVTTNAGVWVVGTAAPVERGAHRQYFYAEGPTPLIAAMRCYVLSKLGEEVELPEGL